MGSNPHANGGLLRRALNLPDFRDYAIDIPQHGTRGVRKYQGVGILHAGHHAG
jgi:xylulose-5-phosphate/fructose-6-phosphate phosphoketolase